MRASLRTAGDTRAVAANKANGAALDILIEMVIPAEVLDQFAVRIAMIHERLIAGSHRTPHKEIAAAVGIRAIRERRHVGRESRVREHHRHTTQHYSPPP